MSSLDENSKNEIISIILEKHQGKIFKYFHHTFWWNESVKYYCRIFCEVEHIRRIIEYETDIDFSKFSKVFLRDVWKELRMTFPEKVINSQYGLIPIENGLITILI